MLVAITEVVLAKLAARVAERFQQFGNGRLVFGDTLREPGTPIVNKPGAERRLPEDKGGTTCRTRLLSVGVGEKSALIRDAVDIGRLITHPECVTTKGGGRFAIAVGGSFTGRGADVIIIDDPMKADDAQSEKVRASVNNWYGATLVSRLDDKEKGAIILVMQRLHEDDLAGKLLREEGWRHLDLPAIAEEDQEVPIAPGVVHRRQKGEVLHPTRELLAVLAEIKREMGSLAFSSQYLQRPVPLEGNLIKRDWLKWYDALPSRGRVVQSWDVASTTTGASDWSVCTTWLIEKRNYYLVDVWRGRLEFPQLRHKLIALARGHAPNEILIEQAGPGLHLVQELRAKPEAGVHVPIGIKPEGDKIVRMEAQCAPL